MKKDWIYRDYCKGDEFLVIADWIINTNQSVGCGTTIKIVDLEKGEMNKGQNVNLLQEPDITLTISMSDFCSALNMGIMIPVEPVFDVL